MNFKRKQEIFLNSSYILFKLDALINYYYYIENDKQKETLEEISKELKNVVEKLKEDYIKELEEN